MEDKNNKLDLKERLDLTPYDIKISELEFILFNKEPFDFSSFEFDFIYRSWDMEINDIILGQ